MVREVVRRWFRFGVLVAVELVGDELFFVCIELYVKEEQCVSLQLVRMFLFLFFEKWL